MFEELESISHSPLTPTLCSENYKERTYQQVSFRWRLLFTVFDCSTLDCKLRQEMLAWRGRNLVLKAF